MFNEDDLVKAHRARAETIGNIVLISFAIVLARLWYLQIYQGELLAKYSLQNRLRKETLGAPRGMIYDRENKLLVYNSPRFDIVVTPQYLKNEKETLEKLSQIIDMEYEKIDDALRKKQGQAKYLPVVIKKNATDKEVAVIETEYYKMPGVSVNMFISREYPFSGEGAHILGYISEISQTKLAPYRNRDQFNYQLGDFIGQAGIEEMLDLDLRGVDGYEFVEVDAIGRMKRHLGAGGIDIIKGINNKPAVPGRNVRLTIDIDLQKTAYQALGDQTGAAVAVDVRTGEVLAMVSTPAFDPTSFSKGLSKDYWTSLVSDSRNPLRDRVIQEHFAPASTFKTITAFAALEEGIIDENFEVKCNGSFKMGRRAFHCWRKNGHKSVRVVKALRESCDVFFYKVATKLDIDVLAKYAKMLGFGSKTGIGLPQETGGLIPTKEWKLKRNGVEWQLGETLSCVIGQSYVLTTPLQLAMAYSVIANGGTLYKPYVIKEIFQNSGEVVRKFDSDHVRDVKIHPKTLELIREGLFQAVNVRQGTAWWKRGKGISMAGKTGTGQVIRFAAEKVYNKCEDMEYKYRNHGVFVGFAPSDEPRIVVAALVEHGCHGATAAAPIARDIITAYMQKNMPDKYKQILEKEKNEYIRQRAEEIKNQQDDADEE